MDEKKILNSIKKSIDEAPIDILDKIKEAPRVKMPAHDNITRQETGRTLFHKLMPYASIAAAFLLVFFGWQYQVKMPDSHIYLDVNPSIEIVTNRQDKVISLLAGNKNGEKIIKGIEYKGENIYRVTGRILDRMMEENYLSKKHEFLLLSVYNKNQNKAEEHKQNLDQKIHEHLQAKDLQPVVLLQKIDNTSTIENYAREYGISVSKMTFIRNLIILNPELQAEDLVSLSIEELVSLSQGMGLELDKIIESNDLDRIPAKFTGPELETTPQDTDDYDDDNFDDYDDDKDDEDDIDDDGNEDHDEDDDDDSDNYRHHKPSIISAGDARKIALSAANGKITGLDFDEDDLEYEVEIEFGELEYEITIDARTGKILEIEIDD